MKILKNSLFHFFIISSLIFLIYYLNLEPDLDNKLVITQQDINELTLGFKRSWEREPNEVELKNLIAQKIKDEIFYREAINLGLDRHDPVIQRRLQQKIEILFSDTGQLQQPTTQDLQSYLDQYPEQFIKPAKVSFSHIYFNPDSCGNCEKEIMQVRKRLSSGQINLENLQGIGYPPIYGSNNIMIDKRQLAARYGELFADKLFKLDTEQWSNTIVSGVGTHLVYINEIMPETKPQLEEVITQVRYAWFEYKSQQIKTRVYNQLKSQYEIVLESNKLDVDKYEQTHL